MVVLVLIATLLVAGALLVGVGGRHGPPIVPPTASPSASAADLPWPTRNGPIAIGKSLLLVDPATGTSVPGIGCVGCQVGDADWSPDGSTMIYASPFDASGGTLADGQLRSWQIGASSPTTLWKCRDLDCRVGSPAWSPDGRSIVLEESDPTSTNSDLVVLAADGTNERHILPEGLRAASFPSWTPDGWILFTAYGKSDIRLAVVRPDGTGFRTLGRTTYPDGVMAAMSPDGSTIALMVDSFEPQGDATASPGLENGLELWVEDAVALNPRLIWYRADCCLSLGFSGPEWSPDGSKVAIAATSSPPEVAATSSDIRLLTIDIEFSSVDRAQPCGPRSTGLAADAVMSSR